MALGNNAMAEMYDKHAVKARWKQLVNCGQVNVWRIPIVAGSCVSRVLAVLLVACW
jgi:hypothetical protein